MVGKISEKSSKTTLPSSARIWVYGSTKDLSPQENAVQEKLDSFKEKWFCHGKGLVCDAFIHLNRFIVLVVDEDQTPASGCSIDQSVHFLKQIETDFNTQLFDRMTFFYVDTNQNIQSADRASFQKLYAEQKINDNTLVFDPMIQTLKQLEQSFIKPLSESWHKRMV